MSRLSTIAAAALLCVAVLAFAAPASAALSKSELRQHASSILHDESLHPGDREMKHALLAEAARDAVAAGVVAYPQAADAEPRGPIHVIGAMMNPHVSEDERVDALLELHELVALRESPLHREAGVVEMIDPSLVEVSAEAQASEALFTKAGLSLKVLAVLGFTNGVISTLFQEATWYNLKICLTDPSGRFQQSERVTKFSAAWDELSAAISGTVQGPISMEDIFAQFSRPENGVFKYQNKEGTPLYYRQVRNPSAWRQLMSTYDEKSGKPAPSCYEWSPDMKVWMPTSELTVSSGYWKGQKPVPVNQDLIKWLQEFCPMPRELSVEDLGFLFGFPDSNGVYSYTAGFSKGQRVFYRYRNSRWEWSANFGMWDGRPDTWYPVSMRRSTANAEAVLYDHINVLKLLETKNPTPLQLSAGNLRMLGLPNAQGVFIYETALLFGTTYEFRREANAWQWRKKGAAWTPATAWQSIDASHTSVRLLVKQLADTNPAAPTAGSQTRMQASAWQATGFLEWAKRLKRAIVDVIATMPGFLAETYTSLTNCSAEVKTRCFPGKNGKDVAAPEPAAGLTTPAAGTAAPALEGAVGDTQPDNNPEEVNDDFAKVMSKLDAELAAASVTKEAAPASSTAVAGAGKPAATKATTAKAASTTRRPTAGANLLELRAAIEVRAEAEASDEATANEMERHLASAPEKTEADIKKSAEKSVTEMTQSEFHLADMSAGQLDELLALANDDHTKSTAIMCRKMREELTMGAMFIGVSEAFVSGMALHKYWPRTFRVLVVWPAKYGLGAPYWAFKGLVFLAKKNAKMAVAIAKITRGVVKMARTAKYGFLVTKLVYRRLARRVLSVVPRAMRFWIAKVGAKILARAATPLLMVAFYGINVAMNWKPLCKAVDDWKALHAKMAAEGRKVMTQDESWENVRLWGFVITKVVIG